MVDDEEEEEESNLREQRIMSDDDDVELGEYVVDDNERIVDDEPPPPEEPATPSPASVKPRGVKRTGYVVRSQSTRRKTVVAVDDADASTADDRGASSLRSRLLRVWSFVDSTNEPLVEWLAARSEQSRLWLAVEFLDGSCLRAFSQVVFANNSLAGLVILASLIAHDYEQGLMSLLGAFVSSLAAVGFGFNWGSVRTGLFGYNAVLCGCGVAATSSSVGARVGLTVVAALISTPLSVYIGAVLSNWRVAPLTFPFNLSAALTFAALKLEFAAGAPPAPAESVLVGDAVWRGSLRGVAQVFFVPSEFVGIAMLVGVALSSRLLSLALLVGSATGVAIGFAVGGDIRAIDDGLFSFNAALGCASIWFFYVLNWRSALLGLSCAAGSVLLRLVVPPPSFTLPFCLSALAFLFLQGSAKELYSINLPDLSTPEAHLVAFRKKTRSAENRVST
jgi:urea transporter